MMEPSQCQSSQCESIASNLRARVATTENEADYWKAKAERLTAALREIESTPATMANDSESLRHTIKTIWHIARAALTAGERADGSV